MLLPSFTPFVMESLIYSACLGKLLSVIKSLLPYGLDPPNDTLWWKIWFTLPIWVTFRLLLNHYYLIGRTLQWRLLMKAFHNLCVSLNLPLEVAKLKGRTLGKLHSFLSTTIFCLICNLIFSLLNKERNHFVGSKCSKYLFQIDVILGCT